MVANTWTLEAAPEAHEAVEKWLDEEAATGYVLEATEEVVRVDFYNIDDAFRFRLQFDEELV